MLQSECSDDSDSLQSEDDWVEDASEDGSSRNSSNDSSRCTTPATTPSKSSSSNSSQADSCHDDDEEEEEKLTVHVKLVGKETSERLLMDPSSSVGDLKRHIASRYSVPMERQRLIFFGKLLLDNSQALGPKGACMRLGTINHVHLSPLPEGAQPSNRPVASSLKQPQPSSLPLPPPPPATDYPREHSATHHRQGRSHSRDTTMGLDLSSSILGSHLPASNEVPVVPIALPVPNLSLEAQLARARRLGTQARERRRQRRRMEASPYHSAMDNSITPDDSFSSDYRPIHHRQQHQHQQHGPYAGRDIDDNNNMVPEEEVLFRRSLVGGAPLVASASFLAPSSLSHSILAHHHHHQPVLAPASLLSRRSEWSNPLALSAMDLASYSYPYLLASTNRETNTSTTTTTDGGGDGATSATTTTTTTSAAAPDGWNDLRASRDRLDGIRSMERRQLQERREEEELLFRQDLLQQVRRSALQLLPAVAEWHLQLERLSQLSPSSLSSMSSTSSSLLPTHGLLPEDNSLIQDTLEQMDGGIGHHWTTRLRPLLLTLQDASIMSLSSSDAFSTMAPRSLFNPWRSRMPPSSSSSPLSPSSVVPAPLSLPPGARFF